MKTRVVAVTIGITERIIREAILLNLILYPLELYSVFRLQVIN